MGADHKWNNADEFTPEDSSLVLIAHYRRNVFDEMFLDYSVARYYDEDGYRGTQNDEHIFRVVSWMYVPYHEEI